MHAYLIVGAGEELKAKIEELAKKLNVKTLEFPLAKIEDTRSLNSFTNLQIASPTAIVINSIEEGTPQTLNAFLKNLEEPQEGLYYFLTTENVHNVLPTIVSRCEVVKIRNSKLEIVNSEIDKFLDMSIGEKLAYTDKMRDREVAKKFVKGLINHLHSSLHNGEEGFGKVADKLEIAQKTLAALNGNGNVLLQLTNLVVNLK